MKQIPWKKWLIYSIIFLPVFLLFDVISDAIKGPIQWGEIWAMKNMFFKVAAAIVAGYFVSTFNTSKPVKP